MSTCSSKTFLVQISLLLLPCWNWQSVTSQQVRLNSTQQEVKLYLVLTLLQSLSKIKIAADKTLHMSQVDGRWQTPCWSFIDQSDTIGKALQISSTFDTDGLLPSGVNHLIKISALHRISTLIQATTESINFAFSCELNYSVQIELVGPHVELIEVFNSML